jgi:hypothetical protein
VFVVHELKRFHFASWEIRFFGESLDIQYPNPNPNPNPNPGFWLCSLTPEREFRRIVLLIESTSKHELKWSMTSG